MYVLLQLQYASMFMAKAIILVCYKYTHSYIIVVVCSIYVASNTIMHHQGLIDPKGGESMSISCLW